MLTTIDRTLESAARKADPDWMTAVRNVILDLPPNRRFMVEDVLQIVEDEGYGTGDRRAVGTIIRMLAREGRITQTGTYKPARTSNGSLRPEWRRRGTKR